MCVDIIFTYYIDKGRILLCNQIRTLNGSLSCILEKVFRTTAEYYFGRWLRSNHDALYKTELLEEEWNQSPSVVTDATRRDWELLRQLLSREQTRKKYFIFYTKWMRYAAVIVVLLVLSATAYWLVNQSASARYAELTEVFVPFGERRMVTLPDGSEVWLNAGSLLIYPKDYENSTSMYCLSYRRSIFLCL